MLVYQRVLCIHLESHGVLGYRKLRSSVDPQKNLSGPAPRIAAPRLLQQGPSDGDTLLLAACPLSG